MSMHKLQSIRIKVVYVNESLAKRHEYTSFLATMLTISF